MEWWALLSIILVCLLLLIFIGVPIAFSLGALSLTLVLVMLGTDKLMLVATHGFWADKQLRPGGHTLIHLHGRNNPALRGEHRRL